MTRRRMVAGLSASSTGLMAAPSWASDEAYRNFGQRLRRLGARAVVVTRSGETRLSQGDLRTPYRAASVRKSVLSALYGMAVDEGKIRLDWTLDDLGISKREGLTRREGRATLEHLLQSRSGVYLPAAAETQSQSRNRPLRGSASASERWHYNNWDFNALGYIYEQATGDDVFEALEDKIAKPLGWRDFNRRRDTRWQQGPERHDFRAYNMDLSARDMARFGALYLQRGLWEGRRLLSEDWIEQSTRPYSRTRRDGLLSGYGYMWWVARDWQQTHGLTAYTAVGNGGRYLTVVPHYDLVIAVQPNERSGWPAVRLYSDRCAYSNEVGALVHALGGPDLGRTCR